MIQWILLLLVAGLTASATAECPEDCHSLSEIKALQDDLKFSEACNMYKEAYDCNKDCKDEQKKLTKEVSDTCEQATGQVNECGYELNKCIKDLKEAKTEVIKKNITVACSDFEEFVHCSYKVKAHCTNINITQLMDKLKTEVDEDELKIGCEGNCASAIGNCLSDLVDVSTQHPDMKHFKEMCKDLTGAQNCIASLKNGKDCGGEKNFKKAEELYETVASQFSDTCGKDGEPTECVTDFIDCHKTIDDMKNQDFTQQCKSLSNFVTCAERLPCRNVLMPLIKTTIQGAENEETKKNCPIFGGCKERMEKCATKAIALDIQNRTDDISTFCNKGAEIEACFNVVHSDKTCSFDYAESDSLVQQLMADFGSKCGNESVCYSQLNKCMDDMAGISKNSTKADTCNAFKKWSDCTDGTYKSDACARLHQKFRDIDLQMMNEYKTDCEYPKLCEQKVEKCFDLIFEAQKNNKTSEQEFCPILRDSFKCINGLRGGFVCQLVDKKLAEDEQKLNNEMPECKGSKDLCEFSSTQCFGPVLQEQYKENPSDEDVCSALSTSTQCLDGLRNGVACKSITGTLEKFETKLTDIESKFTCSGGSATTKVPVSLATIVVALFAFTFWQ